MIRFPIDLRVELAKSGLFLSSWKAVHFETPGGGPTDPEILAYSFGHVHGILAWASDHVLTIVAIINEAPGNGDFAKVMGAIEGVAESRRCPVRIAAIWNDRLLHHLIEARGYRPDPKGEYSDAVIKLPRHV